MPSLKLLEEIVDRINVGVFVVNKNYELVLWNSYMENYSQNKATEVLGENIFEKFPELPAAWLEQKIRNVFILKNFSFTSWEHRPYLFKFLHNRPITGGIDYMRQNCTFLPIKGDAENIEYVCVTLFDVTDTSIYESMLKNAVRSLAEASNRDGLTNIYNRRFLEQTMSKEFARIKRYGGTLSFIIIDLDHFKAVNDTYGHLAGDEILKISAKRLSECLRTSDVLARYGGEEFAVLLSETPLDGARVLAERLCSILAEEPVIFNNIEINISASLGVAELLDDIESHEQLISRADSALYISKDNGRNQVTLYDNVTGDLVSSKDMTPPQQATSINTPNLETEDSDKTAADNPEKTRDQDLTSNIEPNLETDTTLQHRSPQELEHKQELEPESEDKSENEPELESAPEPEPESEPEPDSTPETTLTDNEETHASSDNKKVVYVTIGR